MMKQVMMENVQKAKLKCFNCGKSGFTETAKRHARIMYPSHNYTIIAITTHKASNEH